MPVTEETSSYPVMQRENFLKPSTTARGADGSYPRIVGEFDTQNYTCEENGLEYPLDDKKAARYATYFSFERHGARMLRHQILLAQEIRIASLILDAATFTAADAATAWSTAASATPIADVLDACETIESKTGMPREMFSLICPRTDYRYFVQADDTKAQFQSTYNMSDGVIPALLQRSQIAAMLGIKEVLVAGAGYDTAGEKAAESLSQIWAAGHVMVAVLGNEGDDLEENPSIARTMLWTEDSADNVVMESYREDKVRATILRARHNTDEVLTAEPDLMGQLIDTAP